ncbi:MAG: GAF domain-containing protein [Anaerolineales bacterium]|nr:GAF domain-containing protein [Anaerolineales bacterium]
MQNQFFNWQHRYRIPTQWLPLAVAGMVLLVLALYEVVALVWAKNFETWLQVLLFSLLALFLTGLTALVLTVQAHRLTAQEQQSAKMKQRLAAVFEINQIAVEAGDESAVVSAALRLATRLTNALGASFVPLDEHCQPLAAVSYGDKPLPDIETWVEYLATPAVRERCQSCTLEHASESCPLFQEPLQELQTTALMCFPLRRGDHEFGMLNLYLQPDRRLDPDTRAFLRSIADEIALVLEGVRLRRRELATLRQLQDLREKSDLKTLLEGLLADLRTTLEADFVQLRIHDGQSPASQMDLTGGDYPDEAANFLDSLLQGALRARKPLLLGDISGDPDADQQVFALMIAPLLTQASQPVQQSLGALLVGNQRTRSFTPRHLALLQTIAGQVALIVQNVNLRAELEYKTMLEERTRLAREIHDGLAQTLGFLKLQLSQLQTSLKRGDHERLESGLNLAYQAISEAYQDAREAIDGLHIDPLEDDFASWLHQMAGDLYENSGILVQIQPPEPAWHLSPEIRIQLIRIVQEALSNVRKHAIASQVQIRCWGRDGDLWLEVQDNGTGFSAHEAQAYSRHGLRGMRERAELIGAEFQIISQPGQGATIRLGFSGKTLEVGPS